MDARRLQVLFVRYLFFCIVSFELTKIPFMFGSHDYRPLPQFTSRLPYTRSSVGWIFLHQLECNLLVIALGLWILGYDVNVKAIICMHMIVIGTVLVNAGHLGKLDVTEASLLNILFVAAASYLLMRDYVFSYLIFVSIPLWFFDTAGFLGFAMHQFRHGIDSKPILFFINLLTSDLYSPPSAKIGLMILSLVGMIGGALVFVMIPERPRAPYEEEPVPQSKKEE